MGLRSKCYSLLVHDKDESKQKSTAAGVKKAVKKTLRHQQYKDTLLKEEDTYITQNTLRSYKHQVYSVTESKIGLSPYDNKRYLLSDSISTRAHGHYLN